jgi:two-component system, chemotaxis family, sensor kinase CheA
MEWFPGDLQGHGMSSLATTTERLASAALLVDPNDLAGLAKLHEDLTSVPAQIAADASVAAPMAVRATQTAKTASKLVEQLILREVKDANAALEAVCQGIAELQQLIAGTAVPTAPAPTAAATASPGAGETEAAAASTTPADAASGAGEAAPAGDELPKAEDLPLVQDFIGEARGHLETAEADLLKLEEQPEDHELINSIFRGFHTIKGVAGFLNFKQIGQLAHAAENLLDRARKGELAVTSGVMDLILQAVDMAKALIAAIEAAVARQTPIGAQVGLAELLTRLRDGAAGTAPNTPATAGPAAGTAAEPASAPPTPAAATHATASTDATVKVSTSRLDSLINMVGELVIAQAMVSQDLSRLVSGQPRVVRNLSHLGKITRELQDLTMAMRMVPIQGVFQKMARLLRDLARKAGKQIDLKIVGGETELDRNLVEALADPLVHMVRNAADHGIELPEDRVRLGKDAAGHVELRAYHQGGNIVVEIRDDGRGLNQQRILAKARQAGLVKEGQELTEQEIFRLIFHPGLSTAEKVTDVSGRGVGMDVVRKNVEALRGRIDIESTEGKGSVFAVRLPLTLAVIDGLVVKVGPERYILPITSIERSLQPKEDQLSTVLSRGEMCMIRGQLLPVCRLYQLFNVQPTTTNPCESLLVLVQDGDRRAALLVDELLGQQQVVIKSLGDITGHLPGVSGGAILGDGTISLILDVPGLIDLAAKA